MLTLYRIVTFLIYYITLPFTYFTGLFGSIKWRHRLGLIDYRRGSDTQKLIWLHASSMGEVKVLAILKNRLETIDSTISIFITVMTETGYQSAQRISADKNAVAYLPLDYRSSIKRFLSRVRPDAAVFIETEIWPNIICRLGKNNKPIFLANGRLSERSFGKYIRLKNSLKKIFSYYTRLMVQSDSDRERFIGIGADPVKIEMVGNLKFDAPIKELSEQAKVEIRNRLPFSNKNRLFIAGSTRRGENEIVLKVFKRLIEKYDDLKLILVPRHLERVDEIKTIIEPLKLSYSLYSELSVAESEPDILVVDKMGILNKLYSISDIAFVGGTLAEIGGHNILEPVWSGIPVLYGPSIANVMDSSSYILEQDFGRKIENEEELYDTLNRFLDGSLKFAKKEDGAVISSRADQTARTILDSLK